MSVFKRITDLLRSNVNAFLDTAEDPEKMLEQAILDMQERARKAKGLMLKVKTSLKLLEADSDPQKQPLIEQARENMLTLADSIKQLEERIKLAKEKRGDLLKKLRSVSQAEQRKAIQSLQNDKDYLGDTSAFDTFDRMVEKVEISEAQAQAMQEMAVNTTEPKQVADIEEELKQLKSKISETKR